MPENHYKKLEKSEDKIEKFNAKTFRLAINILAYLSCFPKCVKDGVPDNFDETQEQGLNKIIKLSDTVSEIKSDNVNGKRNRPHFRIGHFRLLRSDYYKNKKGDLVWVSKTMVKGRAKTVYTSDNLDE